MVVYIDANIFVFAAFPDDPLAAQARRLLQAYLLDSEGVTCALTVDEVIWALLKHTKDRVLAIEQGIRILELDTLRIVDVDARLMHKALLLMKRYPALKPRDAVHVAAALRVGASNILSDDCDFDSITEIKRIPLR